MTKNQVPKETSKQRPLTTKQTKFVKEYVKGQLANPTEPGYKATLKTYDVNTNVPDGGVKTASVLARENLGKPSVKEAIEKALAKHNITIESATKPIADGLVATRQQFSENGTIETTDHSTRLKASGMALRLLGADQKDDKAGNTFNFNFKGDTNANFSAGDYKRD